MNNNNNQQTTIFDLLPEEERKEFLPPAKDVVTQAAKAATRSKATPGKPEEPEPDEYEIDRVVFYAGHRIEVPSRTMKLEEVRVMLEETFPELSKERTDMVYDKETGRIIPVLKGHKKGATTLTVYTEPPTSPVPPVYHLLDSEGHVQEVRTTQVGVFTAPITGRTQLRASFQLAVPRIPVWTLTEIVERFQAEPDIEHLAYIVYDRKAGYSVSWPAQSASSVSVIGEGFRETEECFVVAHIHSHGRLKAFWSGTDDADEIRTGWYGVVGEVERERPTMAWRFSCGGHYQKMDLLSQAESIFDGPIHPVVMPL